MKHTILLLTFLLCSILNVHGQDIFQFIKNNEIDSVKALIDNGISLEQEYNGKTPLMVAIGSNSKPIIDLLLENGADINGKSGRGYPPLMYALKENNTELSKYLISKGANINITDNEGNGCILYALKSGNKELIDFLLEKGLQIPNIGNVTEGPHIKVLSDTLIEVLYFNHDSATNKTKINCEKLKHNDSETFLSEFLKCKLKYPAKASDKSEYLGVKKILAIGDVHGEYETLVDLLTNNNIIDSNLDWNFGTGHIVFIGDVFDRGDMVTESLWLIYKLEEQADDAGGKLHFILGNHELINLVDEVGSSDIADKYNILCYNTNFNYSDLYKSQYILGDWLRKQRTVIKINNCLFVHGGIPVEIAEKEVDLSVLNQSMINFLSSPVQELNKIDETVRFAGYCMHYRGYFDAGGGYDRELIEGLPKTLDFFDVDYIIVGHTTMDEITMVKEDRVIAIDIPFGDGSYKEHALLIEAGKMYRLYIDGTKEEFFN